MTLQTLIIVILVFLAVIFGIAILVLTFILGRSTVKDNPKKAFIFVKTGKHISNPIKAQIEDIGRTGCSFRYGKDKVVFVPKSYQEEYHKNKRMIFISSSGQLIASPFTNDVLLSPDEKDTLIYELVASHIGADGMRALKGKTTASVIIIAAIAFIVGVVVVFGFTKYQEMSKQKTASPGIEQQVQPPAIEVR